MSRDRGDEREDNASEPRPRGTKVYAAPKLLRYGSVAKLTLETSGNNGEATSATMHMCL